MGNFEGERGAALAALMRIMDGAYSNIAINAEISRLDQPRRAFVTECVNGALRRLLTLDYAINQVSTTNTRSMDPLILNLLRLCAYELFFMDSPPHAVCDEGVKIAAASKHAALKGFVNANLRALSKLWPDIQSQIEKLKTTDRQKWREIALSCPRAVLETLGYTLGDELEHYLDHANNHRPPVTLRVNTTKTDSAALAKTLNAEPGVFMPGALRMRGSVGDLAAHRDGLFHVMDEGAQFVVAAAGIRPGHRVLDLCAAPGGKAFMAAQLGGKVDARDIHPHKLSLISAGAKRLGLRIDAALADATVFDAALAGAYDVVIADVPCSGLGLINKKPEIRYRFTLKELQKLQGLQRRVLNACAKYLKPGGTLVYATCTLSAEENAKNAAYFAKTLGLTPDPIQIPLPPGAVSDIHGHTTLLPHKTDCDGFYVARFVR